MYDYEGGVECARGKRFYYSDPKWLLILLDSLRPLLREQIFIQFLERLTLKKSFDFLEREINLLLLLLILWKAIGRLTHLVI